MEPVFTLPWTEFVAAEAIQKLLRKKDKNYSIFVPLSRQEKGVDLSIVRKRKAGSSEVVTVQVKASRVYPSTFPKRKNTIRYPFNTWFNRFKVSECADFVALVALYPFKLGRGRQPYKECCLLFSREEMEEMMANCRQVCGKPDRMFGFGFDHGLNRIIQTRGDRKRLGKNYADHLLAKRIHQIHG